MRISGRKERATSLSQHARSSRSRAASRQPRTSPLLASAGTLDSVDALFCRALGFGTAACAIRVHTPAQGRRELRAAPAEVAQRGAGTRRRLLLPRCVHTQPTRRSGLRSPLARSPLARGSAFGGRCAEALWANERVAPAHATRRANLRDLAGRGVEGGKELEGRHGQAEDGGQTTTKQASDSLMPVRWCCPPESGTETRAPD